MKSATVCCSTCAVIVREWIAGGASLRNPLCRHGVRSARGFLLAALCVEVIVAVAQLALLSPANKAAGDARRRRCPVLARRPPLQPTPAGDRCPTYAARLNSYSPVVIATTADRNCP